MVNLIPPMVTIAGAVAMLKLVGVTRALPAPGIANGLCLHAHNPEIAAPGITSVLALLPIVGDQSPRGGITVQAAYYNARGETGNVQAGDQPKPEPGDGEMLIQNKAAGNRRFGEA